MDDFEKYISKRNGILAMVGSVFIAFILLLMIKNWFSTLSFMTNITQGYVYAFSNIGENLDLNDIYGLSKAEEYGTATLIYFKDAIIAPIILFMVGLWMFLTAKYK